MSTKEKALKLLSSCWSKAKADEPIFILLGRDKAAAQTIRFWALERQKRALNRADDEQLVEAYALAKSIDEYNAPKVVVPEPEDSLI